MRSREVKLIICGNGLSRRALSMFYKEFENSYWLVDSENPDLHEVRVF